jgi:hypothetical protein
MAQTQASVQQQWDAWKQASGLANAYGSPKSLATRMYQNAPVTKETTMNYVKEYFVKHRELIMGLTIIALLDHFVFKDAFKEKLQKIVQGLLDKTEKQLNAPEPNHE